MEPLVVHEWQWNDKYTNGIGHDAKPPCPVRVALDNFIYCGLQPFGILVRLYYICVS